MSLYSTSSDYAKDVWLTWFTNQVQRAQGSLFELFGFAPNDKVKIEGRRTYMKIQVGDDLGFTMLTQGGDFGTAGDIASDEATVVLSRYGATIKVDAHEKSLINSLRAGATDSILRTKMTNARDRVLKELERQAIMAGDGKLAKVASVAGTTFTFDVAGSEYSERNAYTWIDDPNLSRYRIVDPGNGTDQLGAPSNFTFTSIDESANTAVATATLTGAAAGDYLVTDYGQTAWTSGGAFRSLEFDGLLAMIADTGTYLGINRGTVPQWRATVLTNPAGAGTLRSITENLVNEFTAKVARRSPNGMLDAKDYCAMGSWGVFNAYQTQMTPGIRYTVSERPDIGWGGREYVLMNGIPLYKHVKAPRNQILLVHKPSVKFVGAAQNDPGIAEFLDGGSGIWFRTNAASGQGHADSEQAYITGWMGMLTDRPRNHGRLDDLTEVAGSY